MSQRDSSRSFTQLHSQMFHKVPLWVFPWEDPVRVLREAQGSFAKHQGAPF